MIDFQNSRKDDQPKKKMNTRGVLKVDGYTEFNPDANIQVTRRTQSVKDSKTKEKSGCCGGGSKS